ncbi:quinate/shikimate dehydrogenase [Caballeronia catudaia]|uniref:Quinate/shikimate dehydrogenase n=1 Tax=Caballeronia catudaia TaxID=1777136 RepID=A0A158CGF8_9BURK|nr:membrane-bound PQQ-dependent dehydrogenase, glucose/quinate/shikimate family [Caballeronia catudaia]SAK81453.1 quinate/shikimate dehydrogenase [Caballeronia catudaia]
MDRANISTIAASGSLATTREGVSPWPLRLLAISLVSLGFLLLMGGGWLILLGGSAYYVIAGAGIAASGVQLFRFRRSGAWLYAMVFLGTVIWSAWETGLNYWGWVPRLGLITVIAFFVSLLLPMLDVSKKVSRSLAGTMSVIFVVAFALAFVPYNVTPAVGPLPDKPLVTGARSHVTRQPDSDWSVYGRDNDATRYSPLKQITPENVSQLQQVWMYRTGDLPPAGRQNKWAAETTPLKIGNAVYLCSATNDLMRLDAATGDEVWRYKSGVKYESVPYTAACRGVVYYESKVLSAQHPCRRRIIEATLDERLIAVDADTGKACETFGKHGQVDLMVGMGPSVPGFVAEPAPPTVVNGIIVTNQEVLDGQRRSAPSGVIRGYSADTGKFVWAWDVKRPNDHGEPPPGQWYSRGTPNSWTMMVGDDKLGLVYVPTGNSAVDYYSALRSPEENEVSSAIVALDARTGEMRWVFQTVHKDVWDYDIGSQPTLIDFPDKNGAPIPAMIVPTKRGQTFVLDRRNGAPLTPVEERPAPSSVIAEDPRTPTQPWSVGMPRLGFGNLSEEKMWGLTPLDQLYCRIKFRRARYEGEFTAPSLTRPWIQYPGNNGGSEWGSVAYDPTNGVLVANWNNTPMYNQLLTRSEADARRLKSIDDGAFDPDGGGSGAQAETPYGVSVHPFVMRYTNLLCSEPPYGMITAIDMHTREVLWQRPLGTARANGPFGLPTGMPIGIGTPNNGGPIITAGGLVFIAAATDNLIRAIDISSGKVVWSDVLPAGGQATPMTYEVNGRQFIVIVAAGHHFMETQPGDYVIAYALPKRGA